MNILTILSFVFAGMIGIYFGYLGYSWRDWEFWVGLGLIYGLVATIYFK